MSAADGERGRLLRWYPRAWRDRYGDELEALVEEHLAGRRPTLGLRTSLAYGGLREHGRGAGVIGRSAGPLERVRAGVLLVLSAWAGFVVAGASYAKLAEHFARSLPPSQRSLPQSAFDVVAGAGALAAALTVVGGLAAVGAFVRFVRAGRWEEVRGHLWRAAGATVLCVGGVAALAPWAHSLTAAQRNGADGWYSAAFVLWAAVTAIALGLWAAGAVVIGRRLQLSRRVLALESVLALGVGAAMVAATIATASWWASMALHAPWFLDGSRVGTGGSAFNLQLTGTMALMLVAVALSEHGITRLASAWRQALRTPGG